jgi:hypothetical protein
MKLVKGKDIGVGDVLTVWWRSGKDTVASLRNYVGPLEDLRGDRIANFMMSSIGMLIEAEGLYEVMEERDEESCDDHFNWRAV